MAKTLLSLGRLLGQHYSLECRIDSTATYRPLSPVTLQACFEAHEKRQASRFLDRARAAGQSWKELHEFISDSENQTTATLKKNYLKLLGWHAFKGSLLEALCLLAALSEFAGVGRRVTVDVFGQNGPIPVRTGSRDLFLWTRPTLPLTRSRLRAKPDLLCTSTRDLGSLTNIEWVLESKCRHTITSQELRAEFGKAFDLESPAYTVVSFKRPPPAIVQAAEAFGLDIRVFPLDSDQRQAYVDGQRDLGKDLAEMLTASRNAKQFARKVLAKSATLEQKLLPA